MPIKNWSTTPGSNTSAPPFGAPESSTKIKDFNDIARQIMADVRMLAASNTIASAATTDLGTLDETWLTVSGVTTITSFGTVSAGIYKMVTFSGALTLTHNATSLILLGGANRTTAAGDCGLYLSLGGGNWKEYFYSPGAGYQPNDATLTALAGTLTAANKIPYATGVDTAGELTRSTDGTLAGNSDLNIPTEKAVKTYVDSTPSTSLVTDTTTGALATSLTISGLDINTHKGYRVEIGYVNGTATAHSLDMYINGLTTATDYYRQTLSSDGTTTVSGRANDGQVLTCSASSRSTTTIDIQRTPDGYAMAFSRVSRDPGSGLLLYQYSWSKTATVTNITSLTFTAGAANGIGVGSTFRVYRKDR